MLIPTRRSLIGRPRPPLPNQPASTVDVFDLRGQSPSTSFHSALFLFFFVLVSKRFLFVMGWEIPFGMERKKKATVISITNRRRRSSVVGGLLAVVLAGFRSRKKKIMSTPRWNAIVCRLLTNLNGFCRVLLGHTLVYWVLF